MDKKLIGIKKNASNECLKKLDLWLSS